MGKGLLHDLKPEMLDFRPHGVSSGRQGRIPRKAHGHSSLAG
jgi:hypothetical protein